MKRAVSILVAAVALLAVGAATASTTEALVPKQGHYVGHDHNLTPISLNYSRQFHVNHFAINHQPRVGGYLVTHAAWHGPCHHGICTSGAWVNPVRIQGHWWHQATSNHKIGYVAYWANGMAGPG